MKTQATQTATVAIKSRQPDGLSHGRRRLLNTFVDRGRTLPMEMSTDGVGLTAGSARFHSVRNREVPRTMRIAGAALLVSAAALYFWLGGAWWLGLALLFAPDLAAAGFAFGSGFGVTAYNATHRPIVPLALLGVGLVAGSRLAVLLALIWLGHIGMDRAVGYGLKDIVRTSGGK